MESLSQTEIFQEDETYKNWIFTLPEQDQTVVKKCLSTRKVVYLSDKETLCCIMSQEEGKIYVLYVAEDVYKKNLDISRERFEFFTKLACDKESSRFYVLDAQSDQELKNTLQLDTVKIFLYRKGQVLSRDLQLDDSTPSTDDILLNGQELLLKLKLKENKNSAHCKINKNELEEKFQEKLKGGLVFDKPMNILLLGQTGVGKSTWINSMFNYLKYDTLEDAENGEVICAIPASFTISNMTSEGVYEQVIEIGKNDDNEVTDVGKSATQDPKTYKFNFSDRMINLIDTPGLGDTRGIEYDKQNMKKILDHISSFDEINGIIIFMKPDETRIDAIFRFCIMELLTNLHKNAAKNIVFCFTNSRSTFYTPGDTIAVLKNLLNELKLDTITLSKKTIFCMDNEAFRFLCTLKYDNIQHTKEVRKVYEGSYEQSSKETKRIFEQIKELTPHIVTDTTTLCKARNRILNLTKPLAEIQMTIQMNLAAVADEERKIKNSKLSLEALAKKLYMPHIELQAEALNYPRTVCTSKECVKHYFLDKSGITLTEYVQICHDDCKLKNITTDTYPHAGLRYCAAMNCGFSSNCIVCNCSWEHHMHITYSQKRVESSVINSDVEYEMNYKKTAKEKIEEHKKKLEETTKQYEEEQRVIIQTSLKFGVFLRENAITPYNDGFKDYLKYLIEQEKNKVNKTKVDDDVLRNLNEMMRRYEEEVKILEESMKNSNVGKNFTPKDIHDMEKKLYDLKFTGQQIKRNVEMSVTSNRKAQKSLEKHVELRKKESKSGIVGFCKKMVSNAKNFLLNGHEPEYNNFF